MGPARNNSKVHTVLVFILNINKLIIFPVLEQGADCSLLATAGNLPNSGGALSGITQ